MGGQKVVNPTRQRLLVAALQGAKKPKAKAKGAAATSSKAAPKAKGKAKAKGQAKAKAKEAPKRTKYAELKDEFFAKLLASMKSARNHG